MTDLVGPAPEPVKSFVFPTPWQAARETVYDVNGYHLFTISSASGQPSEDEALAKLIVELINQKFGKLSLTVNPVVYYCKSYQGGIPDYWKTLDGRVLGYSGGGSGGWQRSLFNTVGDLLEPDMGIAQLDVISYQELPKELQ